MSDKDWLWTAGIGASLLVLWWFAHRATVASSIPAQASNPNDAVFPIPWDAPMNGPFQNPNFNSPPTNANLNINVNVPNTLSSVFMPLFGMVGIAQGALFE